MQDAGVLGWLLVLLCGGTGLYCAARFCLRRSAPRADRAADGTEAVMGLGMAAMAAGLTAPTGLWVAVYGSAALLSLGAVLLVSGHRLHHGYHVLGHAAMVYMAVAMSGGAVGSGDIGSGDMAGMAGMTGMAGAPPRGLPVLTGTLLVAFLAVSLVAGLRLTAPATGHRSRSLFTAPALPDACRVVMGLSMATMLVLL
ncbi:DUF5134 domain-containing protein [Streptacidiphilus fuscans]|uniref:DUF5134 domain-containing protein n=1 Tax=Streptacidiphilus fuscans TaxID=2789292 RepID=A0A931BB57_9ACTN|nr:DUF5134 domain-containing protein [Streptacidiphilus fuscans]MBF9070185.1 DUF5134 domain-containing protein [Streptacidiphilus fuscans]